MRRLLSAALLAVTLATTAAMAGKSYQVGRIRTPMGEILFVLYDQDVGSHPALPHCCNSVDPSVVVFNKTATLSFVD